MIRLFSLLAFICLSSAAFAATLTEQQKISALLTALATSDATFIRNGEAHTGKEAAEHLKMKLEHRDVKTARQFIDEIGSKSLQTGKPYLIKLKSGSTVQSRIWLENKLRTLNKRGKL